MLSRLYGAFHDILRAKINICDFESFSVKRKIFRRENKKKEKKKEEFRKERREEELTVIIKNLLSK
ncbi:hypothetical protein PUN28_009644 [Cardiocondyla obscurior]|uniref:Uncharacterized protein n=1 Tax=Cardiocondyla obscurior TaxID=286306 RepID=A0AAW2FWL2_9HYME